MPGNGEEENNSNHPILNLDPVIETDDILELIPHIDREFAMNVLDLMDHFINIHGTEEGMFGYILGNFQANENDILPLIQQIYDANLQILTEAGLVG